VQEQQQHPRGRRKHRTPSLKTVIFLIGSYPKLGLYELRPNSFSKERGECGDAKADSVAVGV